MRLQGVFVLLPVVYAIPAAQVGNAGVVTTVVTAATPAAAVTNAAAAAAPAADTSNAVPTVSSDGISPVVGDVQTASSAAVTSNAVPTASADISPTASDPALAATSDSLSSQDPSPTTSALPSTVSSDATPASTLPPSSISASATFSSLSLSSSLPPQLLTSSSSLPPSSSTMSASPTTASPSSTESSSTPTASSTPTTSDSAPSGGSTGISKTTTFIIIGATVGGVAIAAFIAFSIFRRVKLRGSRTFMHRLKMKRYDDRDHEWEDPSYRPFDAMKHNIYPMEKNLSSGSSSPDTADGPAGESQDRDTNEDNNQWHQQRTSSVYSDKSFPNAVEYNKYHFPQQQHQQGNVMPSVTNELLPYYPEPRRGEGYRGF